jgi:DNA-binding PadR family transcriptional regulator
MAGALGEFEQLVLLAVLQLGADADAARLRERLERDADRRVSRGALYATLDRLAAKGYVAWEIRGATPERGGIPGRCFRLTESGLEALRRSYAALRTLARGIEGVLGET